MSDLTTVLISVISSVSLSGLTAVCVSLVTPPAEARKEKIMDQYRADREIERQLRIIQLSAGALSIKVPIDTSDSVRDQLVLATKQDREAVIAAALKIRETIVDVSLDPDARRVISYIGGGMIRGIALSDRSSAQVGEELSLYAGVCLDLYAKSRWNIKRRRGFRKLAKAIELDSSQSS